jgi:hypothetical protein
MARGERKPNPVVELTLMRLREMGREPGVLFWVFGFPLVLAIALGIAFRVRGPEPVVVGALPGISAELHRALATAKVTVRDLDAEAAAREQRSGRVSLVLVPPSGPGQQLGYRFDPARAEARIARATVNTVVQRTAGQSEPLAVTDQETTEPGSRYIDFLIPGLIAMNLMSGSMWGVAWVIVQMRTRKLLKRFLAAPMRRRHLLYSLGLARLLMLRLQDRRHGLAAEREPHGQVQRGQCRAHGRGAQEEQDRRHGCARPGRWCLFVQPGLWHAATGGLQGRKAGHRHGHDHGSARSKGEGGHREGDAQGADQALERCGAERARDCGAASFASCGRRAHAKRSD